MRQPDYDAEDFCICAYTHDTRDDADNEALANGCDRYVSEVIEPFLAHFFPPTQAEEAPDARA